MQFTFNVTNRAILRSGLDIQGNRWTLHCEASDLPSGVRSLIADRLFEGSFVCEGVLNDSDAVEPRLGQYGEPVLIQVDGTDLADLVKTVREDQPEVDDYLADKRRTEEENPLKA